MLAYLMSLGQDYLLASHVKASSTGKLLVSVNERTFIHARKNHLYALGRIPAV
jgi:hypothetical protein